MSDFDHMTQIQHVAAEDIGRIFNADGKARVQTILDSYRDEALAAQAADIERLKAQVAAAVLWAIEPNTEDHHAILDIQHHVECTEDEAKEIVERIMRVAPFAITRT